MDPGAAAAREEKVERGEGKDRCQARGEWRAWGYCSGGAGRQWPSPLPNPPRPDGREPKGIELAQGGGDGNLLGDGVAADWFPGVFDRPANVCDAFGVWLRETQLPWRR